MTLYEGLTILAILVGPIVAVFLTLWIEGRRTRSDAKRAILQTLLTTRGRYADPSYSWAIRAARLEFADAAQVIKALDDYLNQVRITPPADAVESHIQQSERREGILISEMLKNLGYVGLTSQQIESYTAQGLVERERLMTDALRALPIIAINGKRAADASEEMVRRLQSGGEGQ